MLDQLWFSIRMMKTVCSDPLLPPSVQESPAVWVWLPPAPETVRE